MHADPPKNHAGHFGYKNHINIDRDSKLRQKAVVTPANVTDIDVQEGILCAPNSAGADVHKDAAMATKGWRPHTNEKRQKGRPLNDSKKNAPASSPRCGTGVSMFLAR